MGGPATRERDKLPVEFVTALFRYEPDTGKLFWKPRYDLDGWLCRRWNKHKAGTEAFTGRDRSGYCVAALSGRPLLAHRVAWACHYGEWPDGLIDHINHDRTDNRICNLRVVTVQENARNQRIHPANTSGVTGVCRHKNKWQASIVVDGRAIYLGRYDTIEAAARQRKNAERLYGFHELHGATA